MHTCGNWGFQIKLPKNRIDEKKTYNKSFLIKRRRAVHAISRLNPASPYLFYLFFYVYEHWKKKFSRRHTTICVLSVGFCREYDVTRFCLLYFRGLGKQGYQCQGEKDTNHVTERLLIVFSPGLGSTFHKNIIKKTLLASIRCYGFSRACLLLISINSVFFPLDGGNFLLWKFIIPMKRCPLLVIIVNGDECLSAHYAILIFNDSYMQLY